jgi:hypothetical protein
MSMSPIPTVYPADEMQCVLDCAAGTCTDAPECKLHCHAVVFDYLQGQTAGTPAPKPGPCDLVQLQALHTARKAGKLPVGAVNWLALAQLVLTLLTQLFGTLFPPAPPAPTPAKP